MKVLILLLVVSQLINASPTYNCDLEGFSKYLHLHSGKKVAWKSKEKLFIETIL